MYYVPTYRMVNESISKENQILGYNLNSRQDAVVNYFIPSIAACLLYKLIIAGDICVIFRHYKDDDPIWASLTLFFMYLPALGSFIIIISDWDYWPEPENGFTEENVKWCIRKTMGHLFFPIWNIWRFAERIFWSIEAFRSKDEETISKAISMAKEPRLIELYVFLQAYLHALPQVLLQLYILMRHNSDIAKESKDSQVVCIIFNLAKVAITTTYYQRFKAQKVTGSQYPWLKKNKILRSSIGSKENSVVLRRSQLSSQSRSVIENQKEGLNDISRLYNIEPSVLMERRRSSDIYLEPEAVQEEPVQEEQSGLITESPQQESDNKKTTAEPNTRFSFANRFSTRLSNRITTISSQSNPDFNIKRVRVSYEKGLQEDNLAGRLIAFLWWFTFLLSRVLAISVFAYFFPWSCVWLLIFHFVLVIVVLLYDVKSNNIKIDKTVFFIFIGLVYIFCIIEFKIRFKKTYVIYFGYFGLAFLENFAMCLIWYNNELESLESDYWYRYTFMITVVASILSFSSMIFYHILVKPKSVVLATT